MTAVYVLALCTWPLGGRPSGEVAGKALLVSSNSALPRGAIIPTGRRCLNDANLLKAVRDPKKGGSRRVWGMEHIISSDTGVGTSL
jgi:hypothetical protein